MKAHDDPIGKWRSDNAVRNITTEQANELAAKIASKESQKTIEELVTEKADKMVAESCKSFLTMRNIKVTPTTMKEAVFMLYDLNKQAMKDWSFDELLVLAAFQNAIISAEQLHQELI